MAKYLKRPIVVEAEQWFPGKNINGVKYRKNEYTGREWFEIDTADDIVTLCPGDWIISIDGEQNVCENEIFIKTYDEFIDMGNPIIY